MPKTEFGTAEPCEVVLLSEKAALLEFNESGGVWVPFSLMSVGTLNLLVEGDSIERPQIEKWFLEREEIEQQ